jgi:hypothetical protein
VKGFASAGEGSGVTMSITSGSAGTSATEFEAASDDSTGAIGAVCSGEMTGSIDAIGSNDAISSIDAIGSAGAACNAGAADS